MATEPVGVDEDTVPASRRRSDDSPLSARHSLRVRLPLLISALLVAAVAALLWSAYREVEATLVRAGGERARNAATQVAGLLERTSQPGLESLRQAAADANVREFLRNPNDDAREAARARLAVLAVAGPRRIELWSATGSRVLEIWVPGPSVQTAAPERLPAGTRPPGAGFGPLQAVNQVVFIDAAVEVVAEPSAASQGATPLHLGYVAVRSTLSINPPGILGRLVGSDAVIEIGNTAGGTWTDMSHIGPAPPPPVDVTSNGLAEYRAASGGARLGALSTVRGTPWAVWVEFPRSIIVAPARAFLHRMIVFGLVVVAIGAIVVGNLSVRITKPLHELAQAADEIAAGDYSRRIATARRDEIGRLGRAFNGMAADVKDTHEQLEARVLERSRALDALRESEASYRAIVEVALDCIITIDAAGRVVEFNPAAEQTFGYKKRDVVGRELAELIVPPAQREAHRKGLARYFATGEGTLIGRLIELTAMRSDGTQFPIEIALSAVSSDGPPTVTGVARNITERKRMEEIRRKNRAIEEQHRRSVEANRLKSEFLANMSHELRTPLNAIIGFADLMHQGKVGPVSAEHEEYLGDILTSSRHLLQLINDVLDLAKVESGRMDFRPESVDLAKLVDGVRDVLRGLAASKHLRVDTQVSPEVATAVVDPVRVKQILYNYLSNAIKFTPDGGQIHVRITPEGPDLFRIDVQDTGIGIPADDLGKLFLEFQQLDASAGKKYQGTGLGLALTKRLAEAHGGRVDVRSTPGEGSTFSVILPRMMTMTAAGEPSPIIAPPLGNRTILVVDDDPATLRLADAALRELGYRPVCKGNAEEALLAAEAAPPAVVIVDLLMPDVDGFEFISRLRAAPAGRSAAIIVWTVKDLDAGERRRLQSSVAAIISKSSGGSGALVEALRRILPLTSIAPEATDGA
jgi:PAS domain S-box-containing protein